MIHVDAPGLTDAPAIVFVHGSVVSRRIWLPQLRTLSNTCRAGLILNGAHDRAVRRGAARFAASIDNGTVEVIAKAGHACNLDQTEAYNEAVRGFARDIGWGSS